jgi:hypothetical protein
MKGRTKNKNGDPKNPGQSAEMEEYDDDDVKRREEEQYGLDNDER